LNEIACRFFFTKSLLNLSAAGQIRALHPAGHLSLLRRYLRFPLASALKSWFQCSMTMTFPSNFARPLLENILPPVQSDIAPALVEYDWQEFHGA